jgi:NhaP-type Na+/H+ and K+/H+ antiporter
VLSRLHGRIVLPIVVLEIVLGVMIGPEVLGWAEVDSYTTLLANFGLALLFFFAGLEVVERRVHRRALQRGMFGWALSLAIGLAVGAVLHLAGVDAEWWLLAVALSTTSLGTLVPILSDAGVLRTALGRGNSEARTATWPVVFDFSLRRRIAHRCRDDVRHRVSDARNATCPYHRVAGSRRARCGRNRRGVAS